MKARASSALARFLRDTSGNAVTEALSFSPTWFVVFGVFLMNVQLGRNYEQRDMVDHAASLAADAVMKNVCDSADGTLEGQSLAAVNAQVQPLFQLVSSAKNPCKVTATPSGGESSVSGARPLEVDVTCKFPCTIPFASNLMCTGGFVTFTAKQRTVAMGCDGS